MIKKNNLCLGAIAIVHEASHRDLSLSSWFALATITLGIQEVPEFP